MLKTKSIYKGPSDATILEKRDGLTVAIVGIFIVTLLIVGKNVGLQSILSLLFNTAFIIVSIGIHNTFQVQIYFINEYSHYFINYSYISISNWVAKRTWVTIVATLSGTFYV